jgi:hypothetical protein
MLLLYIENIRHTLKINVLEFHVNSNSILDILMEFWNVLYYSIRFERLAMLFGIHQKEMCPL